MAIVFRRTNKETGEKETLESMLSRFKKKCEKEEIVQSLRDKEFYLSKTQRRKLKDKKAASLRKNMSNRKNKR